MYNTKTPKVFFIFSIIAYNILKKKPKNTSKLFKKHVFKFLKNDFLI